MRLYIIGMPGTGKTFFGRMLARTLRLRFYDLDDRIEKKEGLTIRELISKKGDIYFRVQEQETLKQISENTHCVISCGGGTPLFFDNLEFIKANGIVIWLNSDLKIISRRIANNVSRRPLFVGLTEPEIRLKIEELFEKRKKFYAKADITIDANHSQSNSLSAVIQKIMKITQRRFK